MAYTEIDKTIIVVIHNHYIHYTTTDSIVIASTVTAIYQIFPSYTRRLKWIYLPVAGRVYLPVTGRVYLPVTGGVYLPVTSRV